MQPRIPCLKNMKSFVILLFTIVLLAAAKPAQASHVMGADMHYVCLGNGKYKIVASVYRDCRGIPMVTSQFILQPADRHT